MTREIRNIDAREGLAALESESVSGIVTDPPYEIGLLDHAWDSTGIAFDETLWRETWRVMKPGAYVAAFAAARLYHRLAAALDFAGFDIVGMWIWARADSSALRAPEVSRLIDGLDAVDAQRERRLRFTAWVRSTGLTSRQIDEATASNMGGHYLTDQSQPAIMTREHLDAVRPLLREPVPQWVEDEVAIRSVESEALRSRAAIAAPRVMADTRDSALGFGPGRGYGRTQRLREIVDTEPASDLGRVWHGYHTGIRSAHEPILIAQRPCDGSVAQNIRKYGTGALDVAGACYGSRPVTPCDVFAEPGAPPGREVFETFHYEPKPSRAERDAGIFGRNVHPTVKPIDLMSRIVGLVTPPRVYDPLIVDPFAGSGTTGIGCVRQDVRRFLGFEQDPRYAQIAQDRIRHEEGLFL